MLNLHFRSGTRQAARALGRPAPAFRGAMLRGAMPHGAVPHGAPCLGARQSSAAAAAGRAVAAVRRGASFGFYSAVVLGGLAVVGVTGYYLAQELLLPSSDGQLFHRAFHMIEHDETCRELLGTQLKAHGESTNQRNVKSRPLATGRVVDPSGVEHVLMQFHVDGDKASGLAKLEVVMNKTQMEFRYLFLDVPGHPRHYLVNTAAHRQSRSGGLFGIRWGPKHHAKERE